MVTPQDDIQGVRANAPDNAGLSYEKALRK